ncbi:MAG: porphobilinogen synthase [Candidatus Omnitrophica bacterium]|nr:porphobilinogen synthase [Candidatus Omnitrophota bacterium]
MTNHMPTRLRRSVSIRNLVRETRLAKENLVMPLFFKEGKGVEPIESMPGIGKMSQDALLKEVEKLQKAGIKSILLFGSTSCKDADGTLSYDEKSPFHTTLRAIRKASDMVIIADVCLCAYTDHGHCGVLTAGPKNRRIDNAKTLETFAKVAVSYAKAGVDMVAPSAMADGQVKALRTALDKNGCSQTLIMSYAVKYASSFYGPFRDIYDSSPEFGDRKTYQMDPGNKREALREALLDVKEGADIIMVKPALTYLDIISAVREKVNVPVAAYNVSGEYSMIKAAGLKGWLDEKSAALEILTSIKRAGADMIITYWAKEAAAWI